MDDEEDKIYKKLALALTKLRTEMEVLANRREYFLKKLNDIDNEFDN